MHIPECFFPLQKPEYPIPALCYLHSIAMRAKFSESGKKNRFPRIDACKLSAWDSECEHENASDRTAKF